MGEGVRIAIVAAKAIGDGLVSLVLARNLVRSGYDTTFYSDPFSQLGAWLPGLKLKPQPSKESCESELAPYDLVLADNGSVLGPANWTREELEVMAKRYLYLGLERVPDYLKFDHREILRAKLPPEKFKLLERIASYSGDVRHQHGDRHIGMASCAAIVAGELWGLPGASKDCGLTPPAELKLKPLGAPRRVILHPYSGLERKNWPLPKYLALGRWLKSQGWEPEFCCAASERAALLSAGGGEFPIPACANLSEFAARIYESYALVGNDSGPVHLASALGVRTVTISLRGHMHRWRPSWRPGVVALPPLKVKLSSSRVIWKPFTPVLHLKRAFRTLVAQGDVVPQDSLYV